MNDYLLRRQKNRGSTLMALPGMKTLVSRIQLTADLSVCNVLLLSARLCRGECASASWELVTKGDADKMAK